METLKLDISKTGVAVSAAMQAKAQAANALLESGKAPAATSSAGCTCLVDHARPDRSHREAGREAPREGRSDHLHRHRRLVSGRQGRARSHERFVQVPAQEADGTGRGVRRPEHLGGLHPRTARSREGVLDRTIVISKSGTTTEPAIAFRLIKAEIEKRYGKQEAAERIVAINRQARGALKTARRQRGLPDVVIPDDVADASRC